MNKDFSMGFVSFVGIALLISVLLSSCGGQEEINLSDYPELQKFNEAQVKKVQATAVPEDFASATTNVCEGIKIYGDSQEWGLPNDTVEVCINRLSTHYDNYHKWPSPDGLPSQSHNLANSISLDLGIDERSYRGSAFVESLKGLMQSQRMTYWP